MKLRPYEHPRDLEAVQRIWYEVAWIENESQAACLEDFLSVGKALVGDIHGDAECLVHATPGTMRYQSEELALSAVTAVTTSRIARKLGLAKRLTAAMLASEAEAGFEVSALGMFDQGFYDQVGFGSGGYEHWLTFDPATLLVKRDFRVPKRLTKDDWEAVHRALSERLRGHGGCVLEPARNVKAELTWEEKGFGLGYFDGPEGQLTHFIWGSAKGENGPYTITHRAYQSGEQLLELLALIRSLGDQVSSVTMLEIGEIQFQDLLKQPIRHRRNTARSEHESKSRALACWQLRILDLGACLAKTHLDTSPLRFNLELGDPVLDHLDEGSSWRGIAGRYVVTLGSESNASRGHDPGLETLCASVGAFSRLWFGIQPASSLAITDKLSGPEELLVELDARVRLPKAHLGWDI